MTGRQALVLLAGVVAVSWAASFIRLASEAGAAALAIAALRLTFASPPMVAAAAWTGIDDLRRLARRDWALLLLSAVSLAFHFGLWVASLERTSVATSVVLVTTQPVFVGLGAWLALRESPSRAVVLGTVIAGLGAVLLVSDDWTDMGAMGGNVMALLGAVAVSIYVIVGRTMRQRVSLSSYTGVVYSGTAMLLLGTALLTGTALRGYSAEAYLWIAVMAVVSQLIGHNAINWSLAALPAAVVAVAILGEPVIASAIAAFVLDEVPTLLEIAGGAVVLAGVYVALRGERRARIVPPAPIEV